MPRAAFISDVHANLEALQAVLADIRRRGFEEIICLGDVVGYGPDPAAATDLVRKTCKVTLRGNHDDALVSGAWGFNQAAREAVEWARRKLRPSLFRKGSRARWRFLSNLPLRHEWEGYLLVHGSPRDPVSEYVLPRGIGWPSSSPYEDLFERFETVCLVGHTHIAGVFREDGDFTPAREAGESFRFESSKLIVNVGSVGQPRDGDWRACYLTVEDGAFQFHRVEYPVAVTQEKIRAIPDLDRRLADRLAEGS